MKYFTFLFLLLSQLSFAQSKSLTKIVNRIDYQNDTIQAVYDWVTDNIKYDVAKLKKMKKGKSPLNKDKYKNLEAYKAALLEEVIKKKKGVCDDYTRLFDAILSDLGYESFVVSGVIKDRSGKINKSSGHSWSAVKVNGKWKLFDPTWGAGYVKNGKKFVKNYNPQWYDVDPLIMIERHFPFDPIWQFLDNPINYKEFAKSMNSGSSESNIDCESMVEAFLKMDEKQKLIGKMERSQLFGGNISVIKKHRIFLQKKIDNFGVSSNMDLIKSTVDNCRKSSDRFGEYINNGKNKRFGGEKWTLQYSQTALLEIKDEVNKSIVTFESIEMKDSKSKRAFKKYIAQSENLLEHVNKELKYIESKL